MMAQRYPNMAKTLLAQQQMRQNQLNKMKGNNGSKGFAQGQQGMRPPLNSQGMRGGQVPMGSIDSGDCPPITSDSDCPNSESGPSLSGKYLSYIFLYCLFFTLK